MLGALAWVLILSLVAVGEDFLTVFLADVVRLRIFTRRRWDLLEEELELVRPDWKPPEVSMFAILVKIQS